MDIKDIFYNHIIKEAAYGRVNCYFYYNILFETYFVETDERITSNVIYDETIIPTLIIKNKKLFDELLEKYVLLCLDFYDNSNYLPEVINKEDFPMFKICPEKVIMTLLWSNATYDDFADPILFLRKRIAFLVSNIGEISHEFEFSPILDGTVSFKIEKDKIFNETPYKIVIEVTNGNGEKYLFPEIKFGIYDNTIYFYAIQSKENKKSEYVKKVNRKLFKIGEGFNSKEDNYEIYKEGNLKDISASFLVALNMAISYLHNLGYDNVCVSSILITRWNAKKIALCKQLERGKIKEDIHQKLLEEHEMIQHNLTEKFLRTFLRLKHHYDGISISSYPFQIDSNLYLKINGDIISNNELLNETAKIVKNNNKNKNI